MSGDRCDGCERPVSVAGGIANGWSFSGRHTGGMTMEFADDTEHFLCFDCIDDLEDDPTAEDVEALPDRPRDQPVTTGANERSGVSGVGVGIVVGAVVGAAVAVWLGEAVEPWLATGAAVGIGLAVLVRRLRSEE